VSILLFGVAGFFGASLLTTDHLLTALAALASALAGFIARQTKQKVEPSAPHEEDTVYDMVKKLLDDLKVAVNDGGPYQHQRNHDILNGEAKILLVLSLMAKKMKVDLPDLDQAIAKLVSIYEPRFLPVPESGSESPAAEAPGGDDRAGGSV
jgi:hypothetical protein